jgi:hypothetical protein
MGQAEAKFGVDKDRGIDVIDAFHFGCRPRLLLSTIHVFDREIKFEEIRSQTAHRRFLVAPLSFLP